MLVELKDGIVKDLHATIATKVIKRGDGKPYVKKEKTTGRKKIVKDE